MAPRVPDLPISPASVQRKSPAESVDCGAERQGESEERITLYHGRNRCVLPCRCHYRTRADRRHPRQPPARVPRARARCACRSCRSCRRRIKQVPHNGRRRRGRGKGWRRGKGKHKIDRQRRACLDALNAKRREQRQAAALARVSRRRRSQTPRTQAQSSAQGQRCAQPTPAQAWTTSPPFPPRHCGSKPASLSRGSRGGRYRASLASATRPPSSLTAIKPCHRTSAPRPRPDSSHCKDGIVC